MIITNPEELKKFRTETRRWQGIPSVEVTNKGRIFACWYSGGITEENGNYCMVVYSDDKENFSEPIAVAFEGEKARAFDACLWIDPLKRLWFVWGAMPENVVKYSICENPDDEILSWSEPKTIAQGLMLNKPIVTSKNECLFPIAVWENERASYFETNPLSPETGAWVYRFYPETETFERLGCVIAKDRWFDEHVILEKKNGDLDLFVRTTYGVAKATSLVGGKTFSEAQKMWAGPNSRFAVKRLSSGNILVVNHVDFKGRNNLTAMIMNENYEVLGSLLLDERDEVSYPDVKEMDGVIYIIYDRERGAQYRKDFDYSYSAREILLATVTEEDILSGKTAENNLKRIVNKVVLR